MFGHLEPSAAQRRGEVERGLAAAQHVNGARKRIQTQRFIENRSRGGGHRLGDARGRDTSLLRRPPRRPPDASSRRRPPPRAGAAQLVQLFLRGPRRPPAC